MSTPTDHQDKRVVQAVDLARDLAPDLNAILFTYYPDVETLNLLHPGETDLTAVHASHRAAADELMQAGVKLLVQRADRAALRRWLSDCASIPESRQPWIDRGRLIQGVAAVELLGLDMPVGPSPPTFTKAPGPAADRLLEAFGDEDSNEFDQSVQALMAAGRTDILDLAVRKLGGHEGDEAGDELNWVLLVAAEGAAIGPSGWAELVALPVALSTGGVPDGEALLAGLTASGALAPTEEVRLLPGWRSPDALADLSFGAVRRVLVDLVNGKMPRDLPPGDTDDLVRGGFGVLLGLRIDWAISVWEEIAAAGGLPEPPDDDAAPTPEEAGRAATYEEWRERVFQDSQGCVPLALVAFSQVSNEIADFLAEAGDQTLGLETIRAFVEQGRQVAGGDEVVCRAEIIGEDLELALSTVGGQFLDRLRMPASALPARAEEMAELLGAFVRIVSV